MAISQVKSLSRPKKMKVICAGFSKTGTKSLAKALRILGFKVYDYPEHRDFHMDEWLDVYCKGKLPDFTSIYENVDAVTDFPAAFWFQEIYEAFPDAKVILSLRDNEEVWIKSAAKQLEIVETLGGFLNRVVIHWIIPMFALMLAPFVASPELSIRLKERLFATSIITAAVGSLNWKSTVLLKKKYREHNERVKAVIPKEKLLVYNVKQGWKPLCEFIECEVPDQEFPRENVDSSFSQREISKAVQGVLMILLALFAVLASVVYLVYTYS